MSKNLDTKILETKDLDFGRLVLWTVGLIDNRGVGLWATRADVTGCGNPLGGWEVSLRGEPAQCSYGVATAPGETRGPA